jgi:hypothetical protein
MSIFQSNKTVSLFNEFYLHEFIDKYKVDLKKLPNYSDKELIEMDIEKEAQKLVENRKIRLVSIPDYDKIDKKPVYRKAKGGYAEEVFIACSLKHDTVDTNLFSVRPQKYIKRITDAVINKHDITFEIPTGYSNENYPEQVIQQVKRRREEIIEDIKKKVDALNSEINEQNVEFKKHFLSALKTEQENAIKRRDNLGRM